MRLCLASVRAAVIALCAAAMWCAYQTMKADLLCRRGDPQSVREAIQAAPDDPKYYVELALLDPRDAPSLLETALRLSPYDSKAAIHLALVREQERDYAAAERLLERAYAVDRTYLPRWTLANYYFRRGDLPRFWTWARRAVEMRAEDIRPLFELGWRASRNPRTIEDNLLTDDAGVLRQYVGFLLSKNEAAAANRVIPRLIRRGSAEEDEPAVFAVVDRLIASNDGGGARTWDLLAGAGWIHGGRGAPYNRDFSREPLHAGFDWDLPLTDGMHAIPGPAGLEIELSGKQSERCTIAQQAAAVEAGAYEFTYRYHASQIRPGSGLRWEAVDLRSGLLLAASSDLSSDGGGGNAFQFRAPAGSNYVRLQLTYQRTLGNPRIAGNVTIISTELQRVRADYLSQVRK